MTPTTAITTNSPFWVQECALTGLFLVPERTWVA